MNVIALGLMVYFLVTAAIQVHLSRKKDAVKKLNKRMGVSDDR